MKDPEIARIQQEAEQRGLKALVPAYNTVHVKSGAIDAGFRTWLESYVENHDVEVSYKGNDVQVVA